MLFHDSIEENLRIANQNATHEQVVGACKKASIHDFIMTLPQGYDTPVGELGSTLSGGERQRLGVARAFLHDAPYILLDEPTNNLDPASRDEILKAITKYEGAIVLVTHDEGAVEALNPERVLLMPDGDEDLWNDSYLDLVAEE